MEEKITDKTRRRAEQRKLLIKKKREQRRREQLALAAKNAGPKTVIKVTLGCDARESLRARAGGMESFCLSCVDTRGATWYPSF